MNWREYEARKRALDEANQCATPTEREAASLRIEREVAGVCRKARVAPEKHDADVPALRFFYRTGTGHPRGE